MKNPVTPAGIEPATSRFVAQHLNHCATEVPRRRRRRVLKYNLIICEIIYLSFLEFQSPTDINVCNYKNCSSYLYQELNSSKSHIDLSKTCHLKYKTGLTLFYFSSPGLMNSILTNHLIIVYSLPLLCLLNQDILLDCMFSDTFN